MSGELDEQGLENQEVWIKVFFNGYFFKFIDQMVAVEIRVEKEPKATTVYIFPGIDADEEGKVDLTPLLHTMAAKMVENPGKKVTAHATGFTRQFNFNKDLLSTPISNELLDLFKTSRNQDEW